MDIDTQKETEFQEKYRKKCIEEGIDPDNHEIDNLPRFLIGLDILSEEEELDKYQTSLEKEYDKYSKFKKHKHKPTCSKEEYVRRGMIGWKMKLGYDTIRNELQE